MARATPPADQGNASSDQPAGRVDGLPGAAGDRFRRYLLSAFFLLLALAVWRVSASGFASWSLAQRLGGVRAVLPMGNGWIAASTYGDRIHLSDGNTVRAIPYSRPFQFIPDPRGGAYILGISSTHLDHIEPDGRILNAFAFPPKTLLTAALAEEGGVWITWHGRSIIPLNNEDRWSMPNILTFKWCIKWFPHDPTSKRTRVSSDPLICVKDQWREETVGTWRLLGSSDRLFVLNDEAETITCLDKHNGHILWQVPTLARPTGAVIWQDRFLVSSAYSGSLEAYWIEDGKRIWPQASAIGRGLGNIVLFAGKLAAVDFVQDRLLLLDPLQGMIEEAVPMPGSPRALAPLGRGLLLGLDTTARVSLVTPTLHEDRAWNLMTEVER